MALARDGDPATALARLERLLAEHPGDVRLRHDLAVVSVWAGDDARALALLSDLALAGLPDYVLEARSRAERNLQRWGAAEAGYRELVRRQPDAFTPRLALALTLTDAGHHRAAAIGLANAQARLPRPHGPEAVDLALACGYVHGHAGALTAALDCYQRAAALDPGNVAAERGIVRTAAALGAPHRALARLADAPDLIGDDEARRIIQDAAAHEVRWARLPGTGSADRPAARALDRHRQLAAAGDDNLGLIHDRVAALAADGRPDDALAELDRALARQPELDAHPAYVLEAAGGAALEVRQAQRAARLYRAALRRAPDRFNSQVGLFIAYSDLEDHAGAQAVVDAMLAAQPRLQDFGGEAVANPSYVEARTLAALAIAYRERYGDALAELDRLLAAAPGNASVRLARADVLRWRGWTADASRDVARVRHLDPTHQGATALAGQLAVDQRRYGDAAALLAELSAQAPDAAATQALSARLDIHRQPLLTLQADAGRSDGGAFSSRDWQVDAHYFSAPMAEQYRVFAHDRARYGRFDEGVGREHRVGVGLEYRAPQWILRGEVNHGLEQNRRTGLAAGAAWLPDDHWRVDLEAALHGPGTPLRGLRVGTHGREVNAGLTYRHDEARVWRLGAGLLDLDDGNLRRSLWTRYEQRLVSAPGHQLVGLLGAYAGRNSEEDRIYFNPASDFEASTGLRHEWRLLRHYDRALVQRLTLEAGRYYQEDFGTGTVWTLTLEHDWTLGPRTRLSYGARSGGRVYDGEREHLAAAFLTLERRL